MSDRVESGIYSAARIVEEALRLEIPSYQRPYVWPQESVEQLLNDIVGAYRASEPHYYIGTIISADHGARHELIDGQQRMTSLMLLATAFKRLEVATALAEWPVHAGRPRLTFAIREQVEAYLGHHAGIPDYRSTAPAAAAVSEDPYLAGIDAVLCAFCSLLASLAKCPKRPVDLASLGDYIYRQVLWVNNVMPTGMDTNRLFSTINTSGLQLEQSDILKAQLLRRIGEGEALYNRVWQACESLEDYFEANLKRLFPRLDLTTLVPTQPIPLEAVRAVVDPAAAGGDEDDGLAIDKILSGPVPKPEGAEAEVERPVRCRSIVSFAQLLLHCYRIHCYAEYGRDIARPFRIDRLLECFEPLLEAKPDEVQRFFERLWSVRQVFDRWVVKWLREGDGDAAAEQLRLTRLGLVTDAGKRRLQREAAAPSNLSMLQSVCYFTNDRAAQYWLTPLLGWLMGEGAAAKEQQVLEYLEWLDNVLSLAQPTQKDASFVLLSGAACPCRQDWLGYLKENPLGTGFQRYWFQKLEYVLWKERTRLFPGTGVSAAADPKLVRYRITAKSSIEHVHPQNEAYGGTLEEGYLHRFGNLVLLSPGENSSYSNQPVEKKKIDFDRKPVYDSLKLALLFRTMASGWEAKIDQHEEEMLQLLEAHYGRAEACAGPAAAVELADEAIAEG